MRPRVDVGKDAKYKGAIKPRDARKLDAALRVPPHKKPRTYVVVVEWTETISYREEHRYPSKQARDDATKRIKRDLETEARKWSNHHWRGADKVTYQKKIGPIVTEYIEQSE